MNNTNNSLSQQEFDTYVNDLVWAVSGTLKIGNLDATVLEAILLACHSDKLTHADIKSIMARAISQSS